MSTNTGFACASAHRCRSQYTSSDKKVRCSKQGSSILQRTGQPFSGLSTHSSCRTLSMVWLGLAVRVRASLCPLAPGAKPRGSHESRPPELQTPSKCRPWPRRLHARSLACSHSLQTAPSSLHKAQSPAADRKEKHGGGESLCMHEVLQGQRRCWIAGATSFTSILSLNAQDRPGQAIRLSEAAHRSTKPRGGHLSEDSPLP